MLIYPLYSRIRVRTSCTKQLFPMQNIDSENLVKQIQKSFLTLLNEYLPKDLKQKAKEQKPVKILSIGCGRFREAKCLLDYFHPNENMICLFGIEISQELLDAAKDDPDIKNKNIVLKIGDASVQENYKEWVNDSLFDLIIVRHPEITFNTDIFIKIFSLVPGLLLENGFFLVTTHYENEKESVKSLLKLLKYNLLTEIENKNPASAKKEKELLFADRFLIIAAK